MRFAALVAALVLAILAAFSPAPARAQSVLSPDFAATDARPHPRGARRPRDLDVRHRLQRPLLHLHLPAAPRRRDRLVRRPRRRPPRRPLRGLGRHPRSRLLRPGRSRLPRPLGVRDLRLALVPGRRRAPLLRRPRGLPRPRLRFRGRALRRLHPARRPPTSARAPATSTSAPPPAPSACASSPTPASTPPRGRSSAAGRATPPSSPTTPRARTAASTASGTARSSRRSASAWPAAPATSPTTRRTRPRTRRTPPGRTSTRWSATSTAASPSSSAAASRRTGWSGSSIARARPGIVDTSALPMDFVSNPGTMNAIINFARRPLHENEVLKWRKASACTADAAPEACWCEPGRDGKCWEKSLKTEMVPAILKGGEDSIGYNEAIQRVYFNIGSCAEQCWINHLTDLRAADPEQRNYGQTPFDIGQCRRDCGAFRAIEDRLDDIKAFFLTARPTDLWQARGLASPRDLEVRARRRVLPRRRRARPPALRRELRPLPFEPVRRSSPAPRTSPPPIRADPPSGSTGSATTRSRPRRRSAPTRAARCTPTTWRAASGRNTPR